VEDLGILLFAGIGLSFAAAVFYTVEKFRRRALRQRSIHRAELKQTRWQLVKYALWTWLAFALLFLGLYLLQEEQGFEVLLTMLLFCLIGPLLYVFAVLSGILSVLRNIFRLPVINGTDDAESS
jgi:hypothetical protein